LSNIASNDYPHSHELDGSISGIGYTGEYGLARMHRDAHGWAIAGGTLTMQRIRIVSELLGRRFTQRA
jgi:alkylation response protein AidB-like acyl-CoA dehydrogenase